jgi:hypothetical protein
MFFPIAYVSAGLTTLSFNSRMASLKQCVHSCFRIPFALFRRASLSYSGILTRNTAESDQWSQRDGYTTALANVFDADVEGNQKEQEYDRGRMQAYSDLWKAENALKEVKAVHHHAVVSSSPKEKLLFD